MAAGRRVISSLVAACAHGSSGSAWRKSILPVAVGLMALGASMMVGVYDKARARDEYWRKRSPVGSMATRNLFEDRFIAEECPVSTFNTILYGARPGGLAQFYALEDCGEVPLWEREVNRVSLSTPRVLA